MSGDPVSVEWEPGVPLYHRSGLGAVRRMFELRYDSTLFDGEASWPTPRLCDDLERTVKWR